MRPIAIALADEQRNIHIKATEPPGCLERLLTMLWYGAVAGAGFLAGIIYSSLW